MKKILFVEDLPKLKLGMLMDWLNYKNVRFEYKLVGSIAEAKCYLHNRNNKVDLVITDMGLPLFKDEQVMDLLQGMDIIHDMERLNDKVPVIINSTTKIPNFEEIKAEFDMRGQELYKVDNINEMSEWLMNFLTT